MTPPLPLSVSPLSQKVYHIKTISQNKLKEDDFLLPTVMFKLDIKSRTDGKDIKLRYWILTNKFHLFITPTQPIFLQRMKMINL